MADLRIENMSVSASGAMLVKPLSFCARPSEMIAIIGPNGAGKTSLLRSIIGLGEQVTGGAFIDGQAVSVMKPHHRAQLISYLPQSLPLAWPIRVTDAVALGRYPHGADSEGDAAVERALSDCDLLALAQRSTDSLSGGELTRVHVARTFACAAPIILVDEPIAALDPSHALAVMQLLRRHADDGGTVVVVMHDLGLAARFANRILGMRDGCLLFDEAPKAAITPENIAALFDVKATIDDTSGWPQPTVVAALT
ncbi:MAG: ABC transporter ATP-binding protein [Pseudomonadota bacterium]